MSFPLFKDDGLAAEKMSPASEAALAALKGKIASGAYRLEKIDCLCGSSHADDVVVTEKDRYGLGIASLACGRCGLVRSAKAFEPASLADFYRVDYRQLHGNEQPLPDFFADQKARGRELLAFCAPFLAPNTNVFELGCGAGGVLKAFGGAGYPVKGCDYDPRFLAYGREQGLDLFEGTLDLVHAGTINAAILCHVLEHFTDPWADAAPLLKALQPGGLLIVEIPGLYALPHAYPDILGYFQAAHVYNLGAIHLRALLQAWGLEVLRIDESCRVVARKPQGWVMPAQAPLQFEGMEDSAVRTRRLLSWAWRLHRLGLSPWGWQRRAILAKRCLGAWARDHGLWKRGA